MAINGLLQKGNELIEGIQRGLSESLKIKYGYLDIFWRWKVNKEESLLSDLISKYKDYLKNNFEMQNLFATQGTINDRIYNQPSLTTIQSQKATVEFLMKSLVDNISSHRDQLNSYSGHFIAFIALIVAIVSLIISFIK